ncbi:hypothetical protein [Okeania sp. SIO2B3]|uniref:hypothetical protein n=1 Tax=Okeania sp. SIO2B3 TaxID=2607784 RepID=UPI0013C070AE|nr:hypothetical protein [Okeania sp. SIO2B3]NET46708.1 hypothetical protein [Okeania sp. SIO2B3]
MINVPLVIISFVVTFLGWNYFYFKGKSTDNSHKKNTKKSAAAMRAFNNVSSSSSKSSNS